jgi:hypothetical protein
MNEGVVESGQDVAHSELILCLLASTNNGGSVVSYFLFFGTFLTFFTLSSLSFLLSL